MTASREYAKQARRSYLDQVLAGALILSRATAKPLRDTVRMTCWLVSALVAMA